MPFGEGRKGKGIVAFAEYAQGGTGGTRLFYHQYIVASPHAVGHLDRIGWVVYFNSAYGEFVFVASWLEPELGASQVAAVALHGVAAAIPGVEAADEVGGCGAVSLLQGEAEFYFLHGSLAQH